MRRTTFALLGGATCLIVLLGVHAQPEGGKKPSSETTGSGPAAKQGSSPTQAAKGKSQPNAAAEGVVVMVRAPILRARQCLTEILEQRGWRVLAHGEDGHPIRAMRDLSSEEFAGAADTRQDNTRFSQGRAYLDAKLDAVGNETRIKFRLGIVAWAETGHPLARPTNFTPVNSTGVLEGGLRAALQTRCGSGSH